MSHPLRFLLLGLLLVSSHVLSAQDASPRAIFGLSGWLTGFAGNDPQTSGSFHDLELRLTPRAGYFVQPWLALGVAGEYGHLSSSFRPDVHYFGGGLWARGYLRFPQSWAIGNVFRPGDLRQVLRPFVEVGHHWSSRYAEGDSMRYLAAPRISQWQVGLGANLQVHRRWFGELTTLYRYRANADFPLATPWQVRLGVDYLLEPMPEPAPRQAPLADKKPSIHGQGQWRLGSSLTYIWDDSRTQPRRMYQEYTLSLNAAYTLLPRWAVGVNLMPIWTQNGAEGDQAYFLGGAFGQYDVFQTERMRFYAEAGLYGGNYCTCGDLDPYRIDFDWYRSLGGGFTVDLTRRLHLDLGFVGYKLIRDLPGRYSMTQYIMGIEFVLP